MSSAHHAQLDTKLLALAAMHCRAGAPRLGTDELAAHAAVLPGWTSGGGALAKSFAFANYHETLAFVNALAWIAHREDHHPDIAFSYDRATLRFNTHSVGGISVNDFICAAKVEALLA